MAPTTKRAEPVPGHLGAEGLYAIKVTGNSMVVHVTLYNRTKPFAHLVDGVMEPPSEGELDLSKLATKPLGYRLSLDGVASPFTRSCTDVGEAQKIKCLRLTHATPLPAWSSKPSELDEPRFLGVQAETEFGHALFELLEESVV